MNAYGGCFMTCGAAQGKRNVHCRIVDACAEETHEAACPWRGVSNSGVESLNHGTKVSRTGSGRRSGSGGSEARGGGCGGPRGPGHGATLLSTSSRPARIESSTRNRARICKYRHIYERKGSPERRTSAAERRGNQSGEIPTASSIEKCRTRLGSIPVLDVSTEQLGRRSPLDCRQPAALRPALSATARWYIYHLIIELVCAIIACNSAEWSMAHSGREHRGRTRRGRVCARVASRIPSAARAADEPSHTKTAT
ncbi:hypothetical protein EVAR_48518_1 [Eumeta japonica]|uniref:Uncharacterized protein n=1 Tax=Eumeta variegata TaxID=151549 RepID=A0A4C1Z7L1_EUMVA|nr:hypothetical protein EVAR_48518_1 [Eumeta japonica]